MISKSEIEALVEREAMPDSPVLSVYLDVDQSKAGNLKRRFEASLKEMLRSIETGLSENQSKHFSADAERARHFVADLEPRAKGLVLFCDDSENFFWPREVKAPVRNLARWDDTPVSDTSPAMRAQRSAMKRSTTEKPRSPVTKTMRRSAFASS